MITIPLFKSSSLLLTRTKILSLQLTWRSCRIVPNRTLEDYFPLNLDEIFSLKTVLFRGFFVPQNISHHKIWRWLPDLWLPPGVIQKFSEEQFPDTSHWGFLLGSRSLMPRIQVATPYTTMAPMPQAGDQPGRIEPGWIFARERVTCDFSRVEVL